MSTKATIRYYTPTPDGDSHVHAGDSERTFDGDPRVGDSITLPRPLGVEGFPEPAILAALAPYVCGVIRARLWDDRGGLVLYVHAWNPKPPPDIGGPA